MGRRPGVGVVEHAHTRRAPLVYGPSPATVGAGGFLDLLALPAYERMP